MNERKRSCNLERNRKGFTLIELLVVITIIGILATVIIINVSKARAKASDARRKSDISQIAKAIKMFYTEKGEYPHNPSQDTVHLGRDNSASASSNWGWLGGDNYLKPYLNILPTDPINKSSPPPQHIYYYNARDTKNTTLLGGPYNWFSIYATSLENTGDSQTCSGGNRFTVGYSQPCASNYSNGFGISSDK
ncbi:MAG: prepilin-type N-terminal cleavage/methylation domain-containing protein [Patescibacteria group bacterium]